MHELKADKAEMDAIESGAQTAIVRLNNGFATGEMATIREFDPRTLKCNGRIKKGSEIQDGAVLSPYYAILSFRLEEAAGQ